jgi:IgGFc binding protein/Bacterial Ig-like domain (group 1)
MLMQFANSGSVEEPDLDTADPFQMLVAPEEQWLAAYRVTTPAASYANYANLTVPTAFVGQVTLDGTAVPAGSFTQIGASTYSAAQVAVGIGAHTLAGPTPFGVSLYGWMTGQESYGYVAGTGVAPTGRVESLTITPASTSATVDSTFCPLAVVRDGASNPVAGIRVDFSVTGANATHGFAFTGSDGQAPLCFAHLNTGDSTVTATFAKTFSAAATVTWTPPTGPGGGGTPAPGGGGTPPPPAATAGAVSLKVPKSVKLGVVVCGVVRKVKCKGLAATAGFPATGNASLQVRAIKGRRSGKLGKLSRRVTKAGAARLVFKVKKGKNARKLYRAVRKGRFKKLRVTLAFTPTGGKSSTVTKTVVLKLP